MAQLILLRGARQLLTLRGPSGARRGAALHDLGIVEDGSVLIRDGTIAAVGPTRRLENLKEARTALEIPANGKVVMPGFIDASLSLSLENTGTGHGYRRVGEFRDDCLALMRSCLQHGTLTADVKACAGQSGFQPDIPVLRKLKTIGSNPVRIVRTWRMRQPAQSEPELLNDLRETFDLLLRRKLIHSVEITGGSESKLTLPIFAEQGAGLPIKLTWPGGSAENLRDLLSRTQPHSICCPPQLSGRELAVLSQFSSVAVFAAGKEVFESPTTKSLRSVVTAGAAIALSSGYESASAASFSMQMAISLAVVRLGLTAEEAFTAATINAAHAAGCAHLTGSLECGKQADILMLNVGDFREVPRQFGINHVEMAIHQGSIVLNRAPWKTVA